MEGLLSRTVRYRDYKLALKAGVEQSIGVVGDYWQLIKTPGGEVTIMLEEQVTIERVAPSGGPGNYSRVTVLSPVDQNITIALGFTNGLVPYDNRTVITGAITVNQPPPANIVGLDDQTVVAGGTYNYAANPNRDSIIISLADTAPDFVKVASSAAPKGVNLYPGSSLAIRVTGSVLVRNPNAVSVVLSASETQTP